MESGERGSVVRLSRKEKERKILEMWRSGHTYKEICEALRVSSKTVAKVIRKAEEAEEEREPQARKEDIERLLKEQARLRDMIERLSERLEIFSQSFDARLKNVEVHSYDLSKWREDVDEVLKEVHRLDKLEGRLREFEAFCHRLADDLPSVISDVELLMRVVNWHFDYDFSTRTLLQIRRWVEKWREEQERKAKEEAKRKMLLARCIYG